MAGRRVSRLWEGVGSRAGAILVVAVLCGLLLSGCGDIGETLADLFRIGGNGDAEAQGGQKLIETFQYGQVGDFEIEADVVPTIEVTDGATRYTMGAGGGEVRIDGVASFDLVEGDVVIERPAQLLVTVVRNEDQ